MSSKTKKLKSLLHESIENIDDESFLQTVKHILDHKYLRKEEVELSSYQENRIEEAKKSIYQGNYLTNEQADQMVAEWLRK